MDQTYTLRYSPNDSGQVIFNDPEHFAEALAWMAEEAIIQIDAEPSDDGTRIDYRVALFYGEEDAKLGAAQASILVWDRTVIRALRRALGWHFGSHELVEFAYTLNKSFEATSSTDEITTIGILS